MKTIKKWMCYALGPLLGFMWGIALISDGCGREAYAQTGDPGNGDVQAKVFYSPETNLEKLDALYIERANASIDLAAFSLTDQAVVDALKDRAAHGVKERIYLDRGELQAECRADVTCARIPLRELINLPGVEIRVKRSKVLMHLKSYLLDSNLVRDGSANFSEAGEARQDNSAVFSTRGPDVVAFERKFQAMWGRTDNLTVAQAVGTE